MCYSAMAEEDLRHLARHSKRADVRLKVIEELMSRRLTDNSIKLPRALEANFDKPSNPEEARIAQLITLYREARRIEWETEMVKQRTRLAEAERDLAVRETKKALTDRRVAAAKVGQLTVWLAQLDRREPKPTDSRLYPFWYTSVIANVDGERVIMPMRYHCRPNGKPAWYDKQYDGLYNARRDSLEKFWKDLFGKRHAILVTWAFYENVAQEDFEHRTLALGEKSKNLVLEFKAQSPEPMLLACLWDCWQSPGEADLYSFAVITDAPPPEVKSTGHDRCPIPIKPENMDAWLTPRGRSKEELYAILDDRERPYYEHKLAA